MGQTFRDSTIRRAGRKALLAALLTSTAVGNVLMCSAGPAVGQTMRQINFSVPPGPLNQALTAFGRQAGLQVTYLASIAAGKNSAGFSGAASKEQALAQILRGSGLSYSFTNSTTVAIAAPAAENTNISASGGIVLNPITVEGTSGRPGPFPGGQVARGGRLGMLGNRDIMNTPFNITSYTAKTIADQQARNVADVTKNDPSVRTTWADGSYSNQFYIRGFPVANADISVNGLYGIVPYQMSGTSWVDRVEILKGPSALLNGMPPLGSIGGNINLVTKRATDDPITRFTADYISRGQLGGKVDIARRYGENKEFGARFVGAYNNGDAPVDGQKNELGEAFLGLDYRTERVRLSADLGYQKNHAQNPARPIYADPGFQIPKAPDASSNLGQDWYYADAKDIFGIVRGEVDVTDKLTVYATFGGRQNDFLGLYNFEYLTNSAGNFRANNYFQPSYTDSLTGEAGARTKFETGMVRHELTFSATKLYNELGVVAPVVSTYTSNIYRPGPAPIPNLTGYRSTAPKTSASTLTSFALADSMYLFDDRLQIIVGGRHQTIQQKGWNATTGLQTANYDESALTPAVGVIIKPLSNVSLYANYIEGLSQGPTAPAGAINVGQMFAPLQSKQYEAGVKVEYGDLGTTVSVFQIEQPSGLLDPVSRIYGVDGEVRNRGVEVNVFGKIVDSVRILGGATFMDGVQTQTLNHVNDGKKAIGIPDVQVNVGAEWDTPFINGLTVLGRVIYTSSQFASADNLQSIPEWTRFDLGARYTFKRENGKPVTIRAMVENVFDESYWAAASSSFGLARGAPRTYLVSTTFDF